MIWEQPSKIERIRMQALGLSLERDPDRLLNTWELIDVATRFELYLRSGENSPSARPSIQRK